MATDRTTEVLVLGGGVMGLSSAWRMAQRGARVRLLEQGRCGQGASQAALGALWPPAMANAGPLQRLHRQSLWGYKAFLDELELASGKHVPYLRLGKLEMFSSAKALPQAREQVVAACATWPVLDSHESREPTPNSAVMEMLSPAAARDLEPQVESGTLESQICRWSAQVAVDDLLAALRQACMNAGVQILENIQIQRLDSHGDRITGATTGTDRFSADKFLICTGVWTRLLGEPLAPAPIDPVKGQALMLKTRQPVIRHIIKQDKIFLVPWPDGRILVGSTTEPQAGFDTSNTPQGVDFLRSGATNICPSLATASVEKIWAALRPAGPKRRPVMGRLPSFDNLYVCAGHFKIGIGFTPLAATAMTELILDGQSNVEMSEFAPGGF